MNKSLSLILIMTSIKSFAIGESIGSKVLTVSTESTITTLDKTPKTLVNLFSNLNDEKKEQLIEHFSANIPLRYESIEHKYIGNLVKLKFENENGVYTEIPGGKAVLLSYNNSSIDSKGNLLHLNEPFNLTFADMIYLSGDFMSDPDHQIGISKNYAEGKINLLYNYDTYLNNPTVSYIPAIMKIIDREEYENKDNEANHKKLDIPFNDNLLFNCVTGGGCTYTSDIVLRPGYYGKVLLKMNDHFGDDAITSYKIGHQLALETALNAKDPKDLIQAYSYEAYVDHFMTDLFAGGHIRTQARKLSTYCRSPFLPNIITDKIGSVFIKTMHDKDNTNGVYVTGGDGDKWTAYGDSHLFIPENEYNVKTKIATALQTGLDQTFDTYRNRNEIRQKIEQDPTYKQKYITEKINLMLKTLPDVKATFEDIGSKSTPKLFEIRDNQLYEDGKETTCTKSFLRHWKDIIS